MQNPNPVEPNTSDTNTLSANDTLPEQAPAPVMTPEVTPPTTPQEPIATTMPETELAPDLTIPSGTPTEGTPKKESKKSLIELIVLVVIVLILLGLGAWYYMTMQG